MTPADLRYTKGHEWIGMEGHLAVVGITHYAQQALGDITFVDLPKIGKVLKRHETLGVVESVKAASDIFSPVSGTVAEVNAALSNAPERINQDPYGRGWICKLSGVQPADLLSLLTLAQYDALCAGKK
jgi:glycine cleavage system H protein